MSKREKKPTLADKKKKPLCNDLKRRVLNVKDKLPTSGVTSLMVFKYPELDNTKGKSLINMVLQLRTTNEDITEKLEELSRNL